MLFGREYSSEELRRLCGSSQQIARITASQLDDGKERGVRCLDFHTGSGLNFTVLPDRCMDIAFAEFNGRNLCWISPTSAVAPEYYEPEGWGWIRGFFGGMLTTCGLLNVGVPDVFKNEPHGAHGRISYTPATNVSYDALWAGGELHLLARGEMRESRTPHYNLLMRRSIRAVAGERSFRVHDTVINEGHEKVPHQILYHANIGFPVLSSTSYLSAPSRTVTPRDDAAADAKETYRICNDPTPGYAEKVYFHDLLPCTDGRAWAALINPDLDGGFGVYVKFDPRELPVMVQWKMMSEGTYVMGLEPANTYGIGMSKQQSLGLLKYLEPGQEAEYHLEFGVISGEEEIRAFDQEIAMVQPAQPEYGTSLV